MAQDAASERIALCLVIIWRVMHCICFEVILIEKEQ
jgi:hypothetical protein